MIGETAHPPSPTRALPKRLPRLGFLGVGWIGRHRLEAIARSGTAEIAAVADPVQELARQAREIAGEAVEARSLSELLEVGLDGVVIPTPSAMHAEQAVLALERGMAVFCQKPLGRTCQETRRVVDAARSANRLLGVDLSYRHLAGVRALRGIIQNGELGTIYAADLLFHNAYGPDKAWFYDTKLSGGGCVIDLGIHLVDLALWILDFPCVTNVSSRLFARGQPLRSRADAVEDFAIARLDLGSGATVQLSCSWKTAAGRDVVIEARIFGTEGGAALRNVDGSFYDFVAEQYRGTTSTVLASPPDAWGGRAAVAWAERLAWDQRFDPQIEGVVEVAAALDAIYEEGTRT